MPRLDQTQQQLTYNSEQISKTAPGLNQTQWQLTYDSEQINIMVQTQRGLTSRALRDNSSRTINRFFASPCTGSICQVGMPQSYLLMPVMLDRVVFAP